MTTLILFLVVLVVLVLVHEAGHFFAARMGGIAVDEFGFGFPPRAWGIKKGKTLYSVNWLPLGGFVKLKGEEGEYANENDSFAHASVGRRFWIVAAGVTMNVVLAFLIFWLLFSIGLRVPIDGVYIDDVLPNSPAAHASMNRGDQITFIDGMKTTDVEAFLTSVRAQNGKPVTITVQSSKGKTRVLSLTPQPLEGLAYPGIGVQLATEGFVQYPWYRAPWEALVAVFMILWEIIRAFGLLIYNLFAQFQVTADISGPIGIAVETGRVASHGATNFLYFIALLSLNLAFINVLPIPALDGGRLFFLMIEKIRGRAVQRDIEKWFHIAGFAFLLLLVILVTYRDVTQHGGSIFRSIQNLISL